MKITGIYKITNTINMKYYIGSSVHIEKRFREHKHGLRNNCHKNPYLQNAWNKYGENNFIFEVIENCDKVMLIEREQYYLDSTQCYTDIVGYNINIIANSPLGRKISEEMLKKYKTIYKNNRPPEWAWKKSINAMKKKVVLIKDNDEIFFESIRDAARYLNVNSGNIGRVLRGDRSRVKGYFIKYMEDITNGN